MYSYYIQDANGDYVQNIRLLFKDFAALCECVEIDIQEYCEDDGSDSKVDAVQRQLFKKKLDDGAADDILYYESPTMGYQFAICSLTVAG